MITKLIKQMIIHNEICETLFKERFSSYKHEDKWNDELFNKYKISKNRIDLLLELITEKGEE